MKNLLLLLPSISLLASGPQSAAAYTVPKSAHVQASTANTAPAATTDAGNRRAFLSNIANAAIASSSVFALGANPNRAMAAADELAAQQAEEEVYFGAGCFWHVQHEFITAERTLLNRKDNELTSLTGYAGGAKTDSEGRVCYHNFKSIADYGKFGHGEVVGMTIPQSSVGDFAGEYFKLFGTKGERADPMDKGGEYRSLLGLPGGRNHPMFAQVEAAASRGGMTLVDGNGSDPDTLGKKLVYVMDSKKYPFYQAEVYHQYHNDFLSPAYGKQYNDLAEVALDEGRMKITGCPDRVHQLKKSMKQNEPLILGSIGVITAVLIFFGFYLLWSRPKFLYMPVYENYYEKDSEIGYDDVASDETEMVEG